LKLNPFFGVVVEGIRELVDGNHDFAVFAEDAIFESRYHFPGWPMMIRGRANLIASFSGSGKTIRLHSGDALVVHQCLDSRVVILEYEVHGTILSSGAADDKRFISVIRIERRKIVDWRDYMDSLAAWTALHSASSFHNSPSCTQLETYSGADEERTTWLARRPRR
jgi:ketosteroid isomerase-like protein